MKKSHRLCNHVILYLFQNEDSGDNVDARSLKEDRSENLTDIPPGLNLFTKTNESLGFKYFDIGWLSRSEFTVNRLSCAYIYPNNFFSHLPGNRFENSNWSIFFSF